MLDWVTNFILGLPPWLVLLAAFAFPALESSAFVGFVFPGEISLVLGGVIASQGQVPLAAVIVAGVLGAIVGDNVGYWVGARYGRRMLQGAFGRFIKDHHFDRADAYLTRRGGPAVFIGRFTAALRVMVPGLAGMSSLNYRTFLFYNIAGGLLWATGSVLLGFFAGASWRRVQDQVSHDILVGFVILVLLAVGWHFLRRWRDRRMGTFDA
jgi:undecaprenyl-diphosphatase